MLKSCFISKILLLYIVIVLLPSCYYASDEEVEKLIRIEFYYYCCNSNLVLTLSMKNVGEHSIYASPFYSFDFMINGEVKPKPFDFYGSLGKAFIPRAPKVRCEYTNVANFVRFLLQGRNHLQWKFGPVLSNEIVLEVDENGEIHEISTTHDEKIIGLAISKFGKECLPVKDEKERESRR